MAEFPSPYEFVKHAFETVPYGGKLLSEWVEEINKHTWISVEERLPKDYVSVIGYLPIDSKNGFPPTREVFHTDRGWYVPALCELRIVTHWTPLPEPPKEEGGRKNVSEHA